MIVAQVFLEAMEGCHLFLSPFFVMQTRVFRVTPSTIVQIFVSPGCKNGLPLISSSGVGSPSRLSSSVSFHSFRRAFAPALQRCSFSSSSQPELLFLAGFLRSFGSCPFSRGSQALFSVLGTFVGHFESCPLAVSCEELFPLLTAHRELTAPHHGVPHQPLPDQHAVGDVGVTPVTNRQKNSTRAHRFLPLAGRGCEDLDAAGRALRVDPCSEYFPSNEGE